MPTLNPLTYLRIGGVLAAVALIVGLAWHWHSEFETWRQSLYNSGYQAGVTDTNLKWQTASTKAAQQQIDAVVSNAAQSREAVATYLDTLQQLAPKLQSLSQSRTIYVTSPAGTAPCLDAAGVQLIRQQRKALGIDPGADPASPQTSTPSP